MSHAVNHIFTYFFVYVTHPIYALVLIIILIGGIRDAKNFILQNSNYSLETCLNINNS